MQAALATLPELPAIGLQPVAAPVGRTRWGERKPRRVLGGIGHQHRAPCNHLALRAGPGAQARIERTAGIVGIALFGRDFFDPSFNAHHALEFDPVKLQRRVGVAGQILALAAVVIGVPDDAVLIEAFDQHHPGRGSEAGVDRGQSHRVGFGQLGGDGLLQPLAKLRQRVGMGGTFVEFGALIAFAQIGDGRQVGRHACSIRRALACLRVSGVLEHPVQQVVVDAGLTQRLVGFFCVVQGAAIAPTGLPEDAT